MSKAEIKNESYRFTCSKKWGNGRKENWTGEITAIINYDKHIEFQIKSRSSIWVICGKGEHGNLVCVPDYEAGYFLGTLDDVFYNTERLTKSMKNKVDAITVAEALKLLSSKHYIK